MDDPMTIEPRKVTDTDLEFDGFGRSLAPMTSATAGMGKAQAHLQVF